MIQIDNVIPLGLVMQKIKLKKTKGIDSPVQQTICKIFIIYIHDIKQYPRQ